MLELTRLSKTHGGFEFGPVDLTVADEVLTVLGPSGSGKSTLLSLIAGVASPDAGSMRLDGRPLDGRPPEARRTGLLFQDGALFPHMTAGENITYATDDDRSIDELTALLEIGPLLDRRPPTLSGGERQRVALARALAADPDALLLDEPLSSLDAPIRRRLRDELHGLFRSLGIPILYVTHDQRTATALGDRTAILRKGVVEQVGPPTEVLKRPASRFVARFTGTGNIFEAAVVDEEPATVRLQSADVTLRTTAASVDESTVTACIHPSHLQLRPPRGGPGADRANTLAGTVQRWLNEGGEYRVTIGVAESDISLTAAVQPRVFDRLPVELGAPIRVAIPPDTIYLIDSSPQTNPSLAESATNG